MIQNATVDLYEPLIEKNSEGTTTKFWSYKGLFGGAWDDDGTWDDTLRFGDGPVVELRGDVQAATLTQVQLDLWGISSKQSDVKALFCDNVDEVSVMNRASVLSDFDATLRYYEIRGVNRWPIHAKAVLVPIQGEG